MTNDQPRHITAEFEEALDYVEAVGEDGPVGILTGFRELDLITGGLLPGTLTVIASRPSMGRTTFVTDVFRHTAITHNQPAALWTLEETGDETAVRILCAEARVARHHARSGSMTDDDWTRLARQMPVVAEAPLHIAAPTSITATELAEQAAETVHEHDVRLLIVDGIQDIRPEQRSDLREREVGDVARALKTLARELHIPVLATAHLNRGPEQRLGNRPRLDDLRESGAITFAADTIVLLHRDDYYDRLSPRAGEADLIVAKNRQGFTATITVAFQGHYGRFVDMAWEDIPQQPKPEGPSMGDLMTLFPKQSSGDES